MVPINRRSTEVSAQYKQQHRGAIGRHNKIANCLGLARVPSEPASLHIRAGYGARPSYRMRRAMKACSILMEYSLKRVGIQEPQ